jgi:hypothetical protein
MMLVYDNPGKRGDKTPFSSRAGMVLKNAVTRNTGNPGLKKYNKKLISLLLFLSFAFNAFAPGTGSLIIFDVPPAEPFIDLMNAIATVETNNDTLAYNPLEEAAGCFQIRPIRVEDYNRRTGSNYTKDDLFSYNISRKIFLYYASQIGPYNLKKIASDWNGSGPQTLEYWDRVSKLIRY